MSDRIEQRLRDQLSRTVQDYKNLHATLIDREKNLQALRAAAQLVVASWEGGDLASAVRELGKLVSDESGDWPWCDSCQSYHHPKNPTCYKLTGQKAQVKR